MDVKEWQMFRQHREWVAEAEGQWVGLLDENAVPLMDAPPVVSLSAPSTRNAPTSLRLVVVVRSQDGVVHPFVDELIAEGVSNDEQGRLVPVVDRTRFVAVQRPGTPVRVYRVTHAVAAGPFEAPDRLEVHGTDMLAMLNRFPCWSAPTTVTGDFRRFTRDWVGPENVASTFVKPRELSDVKFVSAADGATLSGPAERVIRDVIRTSLEASWRATGDSSVVADPPVVVASSGSGRVSPNLVFRPSDGPLLDEISALATAAGVTVSARMLFPGDDPPVGFSVVSRPVVAVSVEQT